MMTFYFVYPNPSIFVPDTEKCPSSWLIHLRYGTKNPLKNKEKRLDYIGRGFIIYDELVYIRPYRGDYHYHFDAEVVDQIVEAFRTIRERPMGGSLDFAVIEKNGKLQTVFLEMNDGYSLGSYGLVPIQYAKLVSARWSQLLNRTDEFDFRKMR